MPVNVAIWRWEGLRDVRFTILTHEACQFYFAILEFLLRRPYHITNNNQAQPTAPTAHSFLPPQ